MSMFDSAYARIKCPVCGDEREREVQFKLHVGRAYSPSMLELRVGDGMGDNFPPIPLLDAQGFVDFECCPSDVSLMGSRVSAFDDGRRSCWAVVKIRYGALSEVVYPQPDGYEWAHLPRGRRWARRNAAAEESYRRRMEELSLNHYGKPVADLSGLQRIGCAMAVPLSYPLDYAGIGRRMFRTGEDRGSYWRPQPGAPWQRRPECRLF